MADQFPEALKTKEKGNNIYWAYFMCQTFYLVFYICYNLIAFEYYICLSLRYRLNFYNSFRFSEKLTLA